MTNNTNIAQDTAFVFHLSQTLRLNLDLTAH